MQQTFHMVPAGNGMIWLTVVVGLVLSGVMALMVWFASASKEVDFRVDSQGLSIRGGPYSKALAWSDLDLERARAVNLRDPAERSLGPSWRTNGAGLPGLQMGWFRLRDKSKALLFVTDPKRVVYVPTHKGFVMLLSVDDPPALLEAMRSARG